MKRDLAAGFRNRTALNFSTFYGAEFCMVGFEAQALCLGDEICIDTMSNVSSENTCLR